MARNPAISFAVAYAAMLTAQDQGNEASRIVWQDLFVNHADKLGIQDDEMDGLKEHRDEKKRRDDDFMAKYRKAL